MQSSQKKNIYVFSEQALGMHTKKRYAKKKGAVSAIALTKRGGWVMRSNYNLVITHIQP
jgi:hypothetical protein